MELALRLPALETEPVVLEAGLTIATQHVIPEYILKNHIMRVDNLDQVTEHDYSLENIYFTHSTMQGAIDHVQQRAAALDAILIQPELGFVNVPLLKSLTEKTKQKAIPLILYTPKFRQAARDLALSMGLDEYHYGAITSTLMKKIAFIKKWKEYKNQHGDKTYINAANPRAASPINRVFGVKRIVDVAVSFISLFLLSPVLLLIAILVKLESKGPVFYVAKRAGSGYRIFNFFKFRTMRVGAADELKELAHLNQYGGNPKDGVFFKIKNDPRISPFGQFLRSTSLDEIPQLMNVLIGDMSLTGNRPLPLYEAEKLTRDQIAWRFLAPAGITGLWQVTKRGKENMLPEERIALDMEYAKKNSFWFDLKIMVSTIPALLQKERV
ncbi:MAG TPA: sugar transferase [Cyclobacteriaceae bacterium]|nr:sugar transferase [Cyclobacteriaceae bacterium]